MSIQAQAITSGQKLLLNTLRSCAAQLVLIGHAFDFFWTEQPLWLETIQLQQVGVVIFFVISGFLITASLSRQVEINTSIQYPHQAWKNYFKARFVRIYSTLFPALLIIAFFDIFLTQSFQQDYPIDSGFYTGLINFLQLQNAPFTNWQWFGSGFPLWSLAIEWWLYLLVPVCILSLRNIPWYGWLVAVIAMPFILHNMVAGIAPGIIFAWVMGSCAWFWLQKRINHWQALVAVLSLAVIWFACTWPLRNSMDFAYQPGFMLCTGGLVIALLALFKQYQPPLKLSFLEKPIKSLADYSFSLYLLHFSVLAAFVKFYGEWPDLNLIIAGVMSSNMLAWAFAKAFEWHWSSHIGWYRV